MKIISRLIISLSFIGIGTMHILRPGLFVRIVPPGFPIPRQLVFISGVCEIAGGVGLLIGRLRRLSAWGLMALLLAVFPANVYMAISPDRFSDLHLSPVMLWIRLPMQILFVVWVWWVSKDPVRSDRRL